MYSKRPEYTDESQSFLLVIVTDAYNYWAVVTRELSADTKSTYGHYYAISTC